MPFVLHDADTGECVGSAKQLPVEIGILRQPHIIMLALSMSVHHAT
jgi:hypothetical protein